MMNKKIFKLALIISLVLTVIYFSTKQYKGVNYGKSERIISAFSENQRYNEIESYDFFYKEGLNPYRISGLGNIKSESAGVMSESDLSEVHTMAICRIPNVGHQMFSRKILVVMLFFDKNGILINSKFISKFYGL